jgi:hypothetical protein
MTDHASCRMQNILTFTPPGFSQELSVKFPDSRLAVCEKCKKNFKTRDMCRVRNTHTTSPWSTAYICITVEESCTDESGKFIDKPMTLRMVQWQPYTMKKPFDSKTPVCAACKRTNRTRSFCRERHKHRHLPWCTVYVLLSALDQTDPSTIVAGASKKVESPEGNAKNGETGEAKLLDSGESKKLAPSPASEEGKPPADTASASASVAGSGTGASEVDAESDDINEIADSRTFLVKVSCAGSSMHWLDLAEYDAAEAEPTFEAPEPGYAQGGPAVIDPNQAYYNHAHFAAAHQSQLKSQQQYFFQQLQQQQRLPYAPQQSHWQYPGYAVGGRHGEASPPPVTAGEAAAAQRQSMLEDPAALAHQHAWQQYYFQQNQAGAYAPTARGEEFHTPPESDNESEEGHDSKRPRV